MKFENIIISNYINRYKRFFMDCMLPNDGIVTAHTPNTGSMKSLLFSNMKVILEKNDNPKRKLKYTTHLAILPSGTRVCINTHLPNKLVFDAINGNQIPEIANCTEIKKEVKYGNENSIIDIYCTDEQEKETFVEVKNVTLMEDELKGVAQFPDAISARGVKHLRELALEVKKGNRAIMFYFIARDDCKKFKIAEHIDKKYKEEFDRAVKAGVEMIAYKIKSKIYGDNLYLEVGKKVEIIYFL